MGNVFLSIKMNLLCSKQHRLLLCLFVVVFKGKKDGYILEKNCYHMFAFAIEQIN